MFYWLLEYGKVLAVYLFIMYFWPSVVFRNYLSKKGIAFRFAFCTTFMIMLLNTTVLMLGVVKLLNKWIIRILFYAPLVYIAGRCICRNRAKAIHIKYLLTGICSPKRFVAIATNRIGIAIKDSYKKVRTMLGPHLALCIVLLVGVIYGMIYFSYGALHEKYYGASDIYVHHGWIDMLLKGAIFGAGIYPEGMHCFVYSMNTLFGVEVYSCLLYLGGMHVSAFLVAVYLFFKEIFPWKFSGILVLVLYLILKLDSASLIGGMARLQWSLPQEFALFSVFLCGAYLLRFLRQRHASKEQWKKWTFVRDENLLIFTMALAVSIAVHFYATIMAFFLCAAIGVFFVVWVFSKKQVVPLLLAIFCAVALAMTPMLLARATGIEFQGSIDWAMSVIAESQETMNKPEDEPQEGIFDNPHWIIEDPDQLSDEVKEELLPQQKPEKSIITKFYEGSLQTLYGNQKGMLLAGCLLLGALVGLICHIVALIKRKAGVGDDPFCGYLFLVSAALVFLLLFAAPRLGLIEIVQTGRLGTLVHILTIATIMIPLDLIMTHIERHSSVALMNICASVLCVAMCVSVISIGEYHSYLSYIITRYPAAVKATSQIIKDMDPKTYTLVASFDELYHVKNYGFHEEAVRFVREMTEESYTLPTEYVFIYLEKQPLKYAHDHLLEGPSWLAKEEYLDVMVSSTTSQAPDILHSEISDEYASKDIILPINYDSYKILENRTVLYSRLNQWVERFKELYPYQLTTVYEDEAFVCYMFRQNPARLLELAIMN